ncbi:MAG: transporter, partial [Planctomycetota bacterium]
MPSWKLRAAIVLVEIALANASASAQELEPRLFSPAPTGMNILLGAFGYSFGNVLLDPAVPVEDLEARLAILTAGYVRTLSVFGASAKIDAIVPVAGGDWKGVVDGRDSTRSATGFGDPRVRFSVLFSGAPALS